jgi:hypothetical protein
MGHYTPIRNGFWSGRIGENTRNSGYSRQDGAFTKPEIIGAHKLRIYKKAAI